MRLYGAGDEHLVHSLLNEALRGGKAHASRPARSYRDFSCKFFRHNRLLLQSRVSVPESLFPRLSAAPPEAARHPSVLLLVAAAVGTQFLASSLCPFPSASVPTGSSILSKCHIPCLQFLWVNNPLFHRRSRR